MTTPFLLILFVLATAGSITFFWIRHVRTPLRQIVKNMTRFANGDPVEPIFVSSCFADVTHVADELNVLTKNLQQKLKTLNDQHNEQQAMLASMAEGVLAVDRDGRILSLNKSAIRLLRVYQRNYLGKHLQEIVRNTQLQNFVEATLQSDTVIEGDMIIHGATETHLQTYGNALMNSQGQKVGALVVLHDMTKIHKLEGIRRDFVANVSHELKTPLTSIKGFVEALLEEESPDVHNTKHFLGIIAKQTNRLHEIIEDLLSLSKIERDADGGQIEFTTSPLAGVLAAALDIGKGKWQSRHPQIHLECPPELMASFNPRLLEQAITNLIDNAIKYSEPGATVQIKAFVRGTEILIQVIDEGNGIEESEIPRLFERFYRVDKARSRDVGGSGLGLAIVKHIIHAHGGTISVSSVIGEGSTFTVHLPVS